VSQVSRKCGILNVSEPYRPPSPIIGIALLYFVIPQAEVDTVFELRLYTVRIRGAMKV
jgi:hypothetical protein